MATDNSLSKKPEPINFPEIKPRACLKCRLWFPSAGLYICPTCTKENDDITSRRSKRALNPVSFGHRRNGSEFNSGDMTHSG